jgi:hypothetical protein
MLKRRNNSCLGGSTTSCRRTRFACDGSSWYASAAAADLDAIGRKLGDQQIEERLTRGVVEQFVGLANLGGQPCAGDFTPLGQERLTQPDHAARATSRVRSATRRLHERS